MHHTLFTNIHAESDRRTSRSSKDAKPRKNDSVGTIAFQRRGWKENHFRVAPSGGKSPLMVFIFQRWTWTSHAFLTSNARRGWARPNAGTDGAFASSRRSRWRSRTAWQYASVRGRGIKGWNRGGQGCAAHFLMRFHWHAKGILPREWDVFRVNGIPAYNFAEFITSSAFSRDQLKRAG